MGEYQIFLTLWDENDPADIQSISYFFKLTINPIIEESADERRVDSSEQPVLQRLLNITTSGTLEVKFTHPIQTQSLQLLPFTQLKDILEVTVIPGYGQD